MSDTDEIEIPPPKKARRSRTTRNSIEPANDFSEDLSSRRRSSRRVTKTILQESTTMSTDDDASQTAPEAQESNLEQVDENIEINNPEEETTTTTQKSNPDLPLSSEERSKFIKNISTDPDIQAELGKTNKKSSEMLANQNGVELPDYEYTLEDFSSLKDYKSYYAKFKKILADNNAGIGMIKINAIVAAIFREFKLANPVDGATTSLDTSKEKVEEKASEKASEKEKSSEKSEEIEKPKAARKAAPKKKSASPSKDPKFKLQKVPPIKIRIPTARKSTKDGKKSVESDHEFEESLLEMERQQDQEDQKKANAKKSRAEEKRIKQEREEERAEAERKRREENPEIFEEEQKREAEEAELREQDDGKRQNFDEHYEYCMVCKDGGDLLLCDTCPCSYHMKCLNPPMVECPDGDWSCPRCSSLSFPEKIEKILAWRWKEATFVETDDIRPGKEGQKRKLWGIRSREYYVKYKNMSYWRCEWIAELRLEVHEVHLWRYYNNKQDMENATWTEDLDNFEDPELGERFFKYGVKELYMEVHRVINHNEMKNGELEYFIKWKHLPYSKCTWETEEEGIPDYEDKNDDESDEDSDQELDEEEQKVYNQKKEAKLKKKAAEWKMVMQAADIRPAVEAYWKHRNSLEKSVKKPVRSSKKGKKRKKGRGGFQKRKEEIEDADSPAEFGSPRIPTEEPYEDQPQFIKDLPGDFKLHDYQIDGINWVRFSYGQGTDVILADEMGLGKTIQTVAFLKSLVYDNHTNGPFLVTVPLSTLPNWEREFDTWAPDLYVVSYYGDRDARQVIREHELSFDNDVMRSTKIGGKIKSGVKVKFHVLLTSYEMVALDATTLSSIKWASLTIDEAHRLKNANSKFFRVMSEYKVGHKLLLTGTPLQNTLEELFYLLNFLVPTKFDCMEVFLSSFCDLSKEDQIGRLHDMLGVHMLRRLKADVLKGFASKAEFLVRTEMSKEQKFYYKAVLTKNFDALRTKAGPASTSLINIMMDLRKVCNHPYLFAKAADDAPKLPNGYYEGAALVKSCGKLTILGQMLAKLHKQGHRVLIFSQMTRLLDLLEDAMDYWQYRYERIDGSVTGSIRQEAIDRFNAPKAEQFVFLLSTKAGGLGINLATADTVVIYDSDWNPHNDIQAFSRAHRIGQKNQVMIYRFVTRNSVEERIQQTAKKKMMLTHLVVRPGMGSNKLTGMSKNEMDDILKFGTEELFKDEDKEKNIEYDEATIDKLLDRSQVGIKKLDDEENGLLNDYLSSFKVATYKTKDEEEVEVDREVIAQEETTENTATFWENLLRCHYEDEVVVEQASMGKGKRIRKQVQYLNLGVEDSKDDADADIGDNGSDSEDEAEKDLKPKKLKRIQEKPLPPLLSRVNGNLEVYGFSIRARRAFMNMIMRWGLPPDNMKYEDRPYVRELRAKSDKEFNAYLALFTRHLCEPEIGNSPTYADGIPKEGMQRQMVLFRIGIMSLIKKKVEEFEAINGDWSEASKKPKIIEELEDQEEKIVEIIEKPDENSENTENPENKSASKSPEKEEKSDKPELSNDKTNSETPKPDTPKSDNPNNTSDSKMTDEDPISDGDNESNHVTNDPDMKYDHRLNPNKKLKKRFMFNIADSGFTELHTLWNTEEVAAVKSGRLKEIWHRMHDYWLLAGIAKHGYSRWADIQQDMQYSLVQQPFLAMEKKRDNLLDMQKGFLQRRFKLLETALIIEEQLRRAELERCQVSQAHEALALAKHFNELESLAEAHSSLTKDTSNQMGNVVLNRCLTRLDELLTDMKQDLARLPIAISQLQTVQERLGMNERYIVAHLLTASANLDEGKDDESAEVAQQREQFKEIAKNKSVATALRFCDNVGPFSVGKAVNFSVKLNDTDDVIVIKDDDSQDEEKVETVEKDDSTKKCDVEKIDEKEEKYEENKVEEIKEELVDKTTEQKVANTTEAEKSEAEKSDPKPVVSDETVDAEVKPFEIKEELETDKTPVEMKDEIVETMETDEIDNKEKTPDKNDDEMK